jgi:sporulation protein YlmC with PRC-barrel domain
MKTRLFDSLGEDEVRKFTGRQVIDESGEAVGTVRGYWIDPSTHRVTFLGVKSSWLTGDVHVVPASNVQIADERNLIKLGYPREFVKKAPTFDPEAELAQVEKEEVTAYFGRSISLRRISSIDEIRPEEAIDSRNSGQNRRAGDRAEGSGKNRINLERSEQAFFNQKGFVTDAMPEVDASKELLRTQEEAKLRNREDRTKSGSMD